MKAVIHCSLLQIVTQLCSVSANIFSTFEEMTNREEASYHLDVDSASVATGSVSISYCSAVVPQPPYIKWRHNGQEVISNGHRYTIKVFSYPFNNSRHLYVHQLIIKQTTENDSGQILCSFTNIGQNQTTEVLELISNITIFGSNERLHQIYGSTCTEKAKCIGKRVDCFYGKCDCTEVSYPDYGHRVCLRKSMVDMICLIREQCWAGSQVTCSNNSCSCLPGLANNVGICETTVGYGEICDASRKCDNTTRCVMNVCVCMEGSVSNGKVCVKKSSFSWEIRHWVSLFILLIAGILFTVSVALGIRFFIQTSHVSYKF